MSEVDVASRPPIGFIVEGWGEYEAYPTFASRILGHQGLWFPRLNPVGYGGILSNLHEHLDDLVSANHPYSVIVSMDLLDPVRDNLVSDCKELRARLVDAVDNWTTRRASDPRMQPMPRQVHVVLQIQKLETWLLADIDTLVREGHISLPPGACPQIDDAEVLFGNPTAWVRKHALRCFDTKSARAVKRVAARVDVGVVSLRSRSFGKLIRSIRSSYALWEAACLAQSEQEVG